ncbi:MAG: dihydroorotase, partial [Bacteroidales bacterium]|nr:dihydroorotase [Bacteroidales bacterium]
MSGVLIKNATIVNEGEKYTGSILIKNKRIDKILPGAPPLLPKAEKVIDATGKFLLPGVIDDQVHFRQPGLTHKGDIYTESKAAAAGGITSFMDMPNTIPQTTSQILLEEKYRMAAGSSLINYSFYFGATNDNLNELLCTDPVTVCGIKVFMGSSTGNMLVDNPSVLRDIFARSELLIAIHSEDEKTIQKNTIKARKHFGEFVPVKMHPEIRNTEACYRSTRLAVELAEEYNSRLHILHLSTAKELQLLNATKPLSSKKITAEVCIHHLVFNDKDYERYGNLIKWNPAIKTETDREALWEGLLQGKIDNIATDHAPHTLEEKQQTYFKAPSGGPLVQHSLITMLEFYHQHMITLEMIVDKMCHAPAIMFNISKRGFIREGSFADLVLVDPDDPWTVSRENLLYKCKWSPFEGKTFRSKITHTFVNGNLVYEKGIFHEEQKGERLIFDR